MQTHQSSTVGLPMQKARIFNIFPELEHPKFIIRHLSPNWFASIMGTGIVANAGALLPIHIMGIKTFTTYLWIADTFLLFILSLTTLTQWIMYPSEAKKTFLDPAIAQFYGAPPMAFLTVGTGFMLIGSKVINPHIALDMAFVLWTIGATTGLATAIGIPFLMFSIHNFKPEQTYATWLMPVVPGVVASGASALLLPHLPTGQFQLDFLLLNYMLFGSSMVMAAIIIVMLYSRLMYHKLCSCQIVPTLWIVLGPIGTSIGAINLLANSSKTILPQVANSLSAIGIFYGLSLWGFGILWLLLSAIVTFKTAKNHLPFSLTWWAFTFPLGVFTTGTFELALKTNSHLLAYIGVFLYFGLIGAWAIVATLTAKGTYLGHLFATSPTKIQIQLDQKQA